MDEEDQMPINEAQFKKLQQAVDNLNKQLPPTEAQLYEMRKVSRSRDSFPTDLFASASQPTSTVKVLHTVMADAKGPLDLMPGAFLMLAGAGQGKTTLLLELAIRARATKTLSEDELVKLNNPSQAEIQVDGTYVAKELNSRYDLWAHKPTRERLMANPKVGYVYFNEARSRVTPDSLLGHPRWFIHEFLDLMTKHMETDVWILDSVQDAMQMYRMDERKTSAAMTGGMYPQDRQFVADLNNTAASAGKVIIMALNTQLVSYAEVLKGAAEGYMWPVEGQEGSFYVNDRGSTLRKPRMSYTVQMGPAHNAKDAQGVARIASTGYNNTYNY